MLFQLDQLTRPRSIEVASTVFKDATETLTMVES